MELITGIHLLVFASSVIYALRKRRRGYSFTYHFIKASLTIYIATAVILSNLLMWMIVFAVLFVGWIFAS